MVKTREGHFKGREVVDVYFDPEKLSYEDLVNHAVKCGCATMVYTRTDEQQRIASGIVKKKAERTDQPSSQVKKSKHSLLGRLVRFVPMTEAQQCRLNVAPGKLTDYLSPRQLELLSIIKAHPKAGWKFAISEDFATAWATAWRLADRLKQK